MHNQAVALAADGKWEMAVKLQHLVLAQKKRVLVSQL
jgi:hypothetical protein